LLDHNHLDPGKEAAQLSETPEARPLYMVQKQKNSINTISGG